MQDDVFNDFIPPRVRDVGVAGSNPVIPTNDFPKYFLIGCALGSRLIVRLGSNWGPLNQRTFGRRERPESVVFESHKVTAETAPYLEMVRLGLDSQLSPPNSGRIASASASFLMIGRSYAMCAGRNHADTLALTVSEGIDPLP